MADKAYAADLAERYDRVHFGGRSGRYILQKDCQALGLLLPPPPCRVLDIPCGTGIYAAELEELGYQIVAADASLPMLQLAGGRGLATRTLCDVNALPFEDNSLDAVITLRLFSHFDVAEMRRGLRELGRVIKPGGRVIFDSFRWTPRRWPLLRRFAAQNHIHEIAPGEVAAMVRSVGLQVVDTETRYLFSPIWQRKLPYPLLRALTVLESALPDRSLLRTFWACTKERAS